MGRYTNLYIWSCIRNREPQTQQSAKAIKLMGLVAKWVLYQIRLNFQIAQLFTKSPGQVTASYRRWFHTTKA